jgi:hypothetical protein
LNVSCRTTWITSIPLGSTSATSPPRVVVMLESVTLCPCAFSPDEELWLSRLFSALLAPSLPSSAETCEFAVEAREFFTVPSVEAVRLSDTTTAMGSCTRVAFTSLTRFVSRPSGVQIEPGVRFSAALAAVTLAM